MTRPETITVYNFHQDETRSIEEMPKLAPFKATRELIASLGGELLEGTAEEVPGESMDAEGRYQRIATGWGALA